MLTNLEEIYVKDIYQQIAFHFSNTRQYTWSWISEFINSQPKNSNICDIGCGNGRNMQFPEYKFIGVDNCRAFIEICRSKNLEVVEANMTRLPFKDNIFDAIICIAAFHHISSNRARIMSLLEMKRIIKNDGKIMISVWSINQPLKTRRVFENHGDNFVKWNKFGQEYDRYYYIFQDTEIKSLFKQSGLQIIDSKHDCGNEIYTLIKV